MKRPAMLVLCTLFSASVFAQNLSSGDRDFLEKAAHAGHAEVEASQMALKKAASPQVKSFAEQMVKDHTAANQELTALATKKGVKVPVEPTIVDKAKLTALGAMDGRNFDERYASQMGVAAHEESVQLFQKAAQGAEDADVKAFANKTLPKLRHHLGMAQELKATVEKAKQ